ncbi:MAG: polysaccharide biosynthesis tyrosine autokinase [Marinilabiliaceae bacterium]|nr:polysaccharide biosynthesis tyrosine autokinase [Marinilabiliaceae bacterium]
MNGEYTEESLYNEKSFDLKNVFYRALQYWYIIPICLFLATGGAFYLLKKTLPMYEIGNRLLISDNQGQLPTIGSEEGALPGINLGTINNIENQLIILTSFSQIEKTLQQLDFTISYFKKEMFLTQEIYKKKPFKIVPDTIGHQLLNNFIHLEFISDKEFYLRIEGQDEFVEKHKLFEKIELPNASFSVRPIENRFTSAIERHKNYSFKIHDSQWLIAHYQKKVRITPVQRGSSIYEISIHENNIQKGKDFLNQLAINSVNYTLEKKNQIANNTINFIERQLVGVSDSLSVAKNMLENFRSRNEMMDISMQGQMIIEQSQELEIQKTNVTLQLDYYKYLTEFLQSDQNVLNLLPPSSQGVNNEVLTQMISELSALNAEKASLQFNSKIENPSITRISRQIETLKNSILQQAKSNINTTTTALADIDTRLMQLSRQIRRLPKTEQIQFDIERKFQSTDNMYTYLMERRSEAQLAKASNMPDNEIIEAASPRGKVAPDQKRFIIIVVLLGLFFPAVIIFAVVFFNNKVLSKEDLNTLTNLPFIGIIPARIKKQNGIAMIHNPRSVLAESIRSIRTAIDFYPSTASNRTILITSSLPGEGKTFCAVNLATSYAQLGKKTILIGFDLRKPTIEKYMNIKTNSHGLSRFLVKDHDLSNNHIIEATEIPFLEVIPTGEIPPNPVELIAGPHTQTLLQELKQLYDVIIIDTPPIGLVTDAQLLAKYTDINILVTRHNMTPKPLLENLLNDQKIKSMKNLCLLLNDIPVNKRGYSYNYGYGSDYYSN